MPVTFKVHFKVHTVTNTKVIFVYKIIHSPASQSNNLCIFIGEAVLLITNIERIYGQ